jgi:hypothetical protein
LGLSKFIKALETIIYNGLVIIEVYVDLSKIIGVATIVATIQIDKLYLRQYRTVKEQRKSRTNGRISV